MMSKNNLCTFMNRLFLYTFLTSMGSFSVHATALDPTTSPPSVAADADVSSPLDQPSPFLGYAPMTPTNLMNLYWKSGVFNPKNDQTITEYIQTSACDQYQKKFKDDFAWPEMIKTTRAYVSKYGPNFATMFWVMQPVALGRYIPDKNEFQITDDTQYRNVRRMVFANFASTGGLCPNTPPPRSAPMQAEISVGRGFSLTHIPMDHDFARKTIAYMDNRLKGLEVRLENRDRFAYVKFYYTVLGTGVRKIQPGDDLKSILSGPSVSFTGTMDGYEIFADPNASYLMYRWVNPDKKQ